MARVAAFDGVVTSNDEQSGEGPEQERDLESNSPVVADKGSQLMQGHGIDDTLCAHWSPMTSRNRGLLSAARG